MTVQSKNTTKKELENIAIFGLSAKEDKHSTKQSIVNKGKCFQFLFTGNKCFLTVHVTKIDHSSSIREKIFFFELLIKNFFFFNHFFTLIDNAQKEKSIIK